MMESVTVPGNNSLNFSSILSDYHESHDEKVLSVIEDKMQEI